MASTRSIRHLRALGEVENVTGKYLSKLKEATVVPISYDQQMQNLLWDTTVELLGFEW